MFRKLPYLAAAALSLALLAGCGGPSADPGTDPTDSPEPVATQDVSTPEPTPESTPEPTPDPTPDATATTEVPFDPPYQFGVPVEGSEPAADDSFLENAAFLGDSRTEGLQMFGGLKCGTFFWSRGMNVYLADDEDHKIFEVDGEELTMIGALGKRSYDSVYIMIGVNELGYTPESYEKGLSNLVDKVLAAQPEAVVYLQIMPPLNDEMCRENKLADYINNDNLRTFNEIIVRMAEEKKVALLNTAEAYTGEDGQLPAELASDGCHFAIKAYSRWSDYIRTHVLDRETYFSSRGDA